MTPLPLKSARVPVADCDPGDAMTDTEASTFPPFEGRQVATASVSAVTGIARALSEALAAEPQTWFHGDQVYIVVECDVADIGHARVEATDKLTRRYKLATRVATMVDGDLVELALDRQIMLNEELKLAQQREREERDGVQRLKGTEPWSMPDDDDEGEPG